MSWNIAGIGKPAALKAELNRQIELAKKGTVGLPHEHASVALIQEVIEGQLNFLEENAPGCAVQVAASGSAYPKTENYPGGTATELSVKTLGVFVE